MIIQGSTSLHAHLAQLGITAEPSDAQLHEYLREVRVVPNKVDPITIEESSSSLSQSQVPRIKS